MFDRAAHSFHKRLFRIQTDVQWQQIVFKKKCNYFVGTYYINILCILIDAHVRSAQAHIIFIFKRISHVGCWAFKRNVAQRQLENECIVP